MTGSKGYKDTLRDIQVELVKLQRHLIKSNLRILILFEGRDAAGRDGVIKRIPEHLSPRDIRVVAVGKPSDRDRRSWYFQRYVPFLACCRFRGQQVKPAWHGPRTPWG